MALSAAEQYMLELINRMRLDPGAEAARLGVSLNFDLPNGTIANYARQVLAPNALLERAAEGQSVWLLQTGEWTHDGANNSQPWDRVVATGYKASSVGENLSWTGTTGSLDLNRAIDAQHKDLFESLTIV